MVEATEEVRLTPQRRAVLAVLTAAQDHPTAAEVYARVRDQQPGIGAATVYRALSLLVDSGAALELSLGGGSAASRYDANTTRHDHLVCDGCGRAVDVDYPVLGPSVAELAVRTGFLVTSYDLQFHGRCPQCRPVQAAATPKPPASQTPTPHNPPHALRED